MSKRIIFYISWSKSLCTFLEIFLWGYLLSSDFTLFSYNPSVTISLWLRSVTLKMISSVRNMSLWYNYFPYSHTIFYKKSDSYCLCLCSLLGNTGTLEKLNWEYLSTIAGIKLFSKWFPFETSHLLCFHSCMNALQSPFQKVNI